MERYLRAWVVWNVNYGPDSYGTLPTGLRSMERQLRVWFKWNVTFEYDSYDTSHSVMIRIKRHILGLTQMERHF